MSETNTITGLVRPGARLGRRLGFPTANVELSGAMPGQEGVWFARVSLPDGSRYWALVNIGTRPTVDGDHGCRAEAWLIGFGGDLYGQRIEIGLLKYIRPERRFSSLEELQQALGKDKEKANEIIQSNEFTL